MPEYEIVIQRKEKEEA